MKNSNLLSLNNTAAADFLFQDNSYINFELPKYFSFSKLLSAVRDSVEILNIKFLCNAKDRINVNYHIYGNKDGSYAWRKYELINPILYASLVKLITEKNAWTEIKKNLKSSTTIKSLGMPVIDFELGQQKASQIKEWFEEVEKESLRLALDFEYIHQTDITDCYGSIYTHSISWALHGKETSKEKRGYDDLLGNKIDHHLQAMSYGQTNGIPQGSILMDFISEIVLSYADRETTKKIPKGISDYKILRYRDDYRIFTRNPVDGEIIMKILNNILADLGMSLNTLKTKKSDTVILDSIKADKLYSLNLNELNTENLRDELLRIYMLGRSYPNSGSILKRLALIFEKYDEFKVDYDGGEMVSILVNIGFENPRSFPHAMSIISKILEESIYFLEKEDIIDKIFRKIKLLPNNGFFEIWLQRIFIKDSELIEKYKKEFSDNLCKIDACDTDSLFNNSWYTKAKFGDIPCIDLSVMDEINNIIEDEEISALDWYLSR